MISMKPWRTALTIAGFDGSGGAGIQADLKTFSALGVYGMTVLTALPVQNTCGVRRCYDISLPCIEDQLLAIFEDIRPHSIKVGMLFSAPIVELVANFLRQYAVDIPIVLDPVMVAKSGSPLLQTEAMAVLKEKLLPLATIVTPNIPEAHALVGLNDDLLDLSQKILQLGANAVLLKGGHLSGDGSDDLFLQNDGTRQWLYATRINTKNTHGTGCTLSAAICAFLAKDKSLLEACVDAKEYLSAAILAAAETSVGKGWGPVHHFYDVWATK